MSNDETIEGVRVRRHGAQTSPKVLCVHGFADDGSAFLPLRDTSLTEAFELVVPDLPGFGESAPPALGNASIGVLADSVLRVADALSPDSPVALVGHSVGSAVAVAAAHRAPLRIRALLSIEGNLTADDAYFSGRAVGYRDADAFKRAFVDAVEAMAAGEQTMTRYLDAVRRADARSMWTLGRDAAERGRDDGFGRAYAELAVHGVHALYFWGRHNSPASTARFVDELIGAGLDCREFTRSGHWKSVDDPHATARVARAAFASLSPA